MSFEGIIDGVECKKCGSYRYVNSDEEANEWIKNHNCPRKLNRKENEE